MARVLMLDLRKSPVARRHGGIRRARVGVEEGGILFAVIGPPEVARARGRYVMSLSRGARLLSVDRSVVQ